MKKIISILLLVIFVSANFSWGQGEDPTCTCTNGVVDSCPTTSLGAGIAGSNCSCSYGNDVLSCTETVIESGNTPLAPSDSVMGISCSETQLTNGQCKLNIYDTLGIRKSVRNSGDPTSVGLFVQDVVLSATFFIGTLVTVALVVSGLMFIFAASSGKDPANAKKGIVGSLVGLLIVVSSYVIIRLVQYIAKGF
ncbi:MAG: hypothetical protein WC010_03630 [Candidatus Absconditabacterales bacterium]